MKTTIWLKKNIVIYIGGNPEKGEPPVITLDVKEPQITFDTNKSSVQISESN